MSGQSIEHLVANHWAEPLDADDEEVLGFWLRAAESYRDAAVAGVSATGRFKQLYDAARQGVVAFIAAHGYRARGAAGHHQHTFAAGAALAPEDLQGSIAGLQVLRGVRHELEYGAHRSVADAEVEALATRICTLLNGLAAEIRRIRPRLAGRLPSLPCGD